MDLQWERLQPLQGLADRGLADAVFLGEAGARQDGVGRDLDRDDPQSQIFIDAAGRGSVRSGGDRAHGTETLLENCHCRPPFPHRIIVADGPPVASFVTMTYDRRTLHAATD